MPNYCYLNGKYLLQNIAAISVNDLGVLRSWGVFDFLRTYNGRPFLLKEHLARFRRSARLEKIKIPISDEKITTVITKLLKMNRYREANIKIVLTAGPIGKNSPTLYILAEKHRDRPAKLYAKGIKLVTCEFQRELPAAKYLDYSNAFRLQSWRDRQGAFEILYTHQGQVLEATTSNIFIFSKGVLVTPKKDILIGITRNFVLKLARGRFKTEERGISRKELANADEVFITATTKEILPVTRIDNRKVADGRVGEGTKELMAIFREKTRESK